MCLIVFSAFSHPRYRLVLAANRDELYARPAERAHAWPGPRGVVAGVDVEAGGTWLGVTRTGRFAALTNYRDPRDMRSKDPSEPSRGALVRDFLEGDLSPSAYVASVSERGPLYRGFNLIAGDAETVAYTSNRGAGPLAIAPGIHGLSNHLLDTPWPKVERGKRALREALSDDRDVDVERLLAAFHDRTRAPDAELPDTGVGLALERVLAPMFIESPGYGTRCTSLLLIDRAGRVTFVERTHAPEPLGDVRWDSPVSSS